MQMFFLRHKCRLKESKTQLRLTAFKFKIIKHAPLNAIVVFFCLLLSKLLVKFLVGKNISCVMASLRKEVLM